MTVFPPDYDSPPNATHRKPLLYVVARTIRYLEEREDLFVDKEKSEGRVAMTFAAGCDPALPYHSYVWPDADLPPGLEPLPIETPGAFFQWPSMMQCKLELFPFADHTRGPFVVVLGLGTAEHKTFAFCLCSICGRPESWANYTHSQLSGHLHMYLLPELSDVLSGKYVTIVVDSTKTMIALYRMLGLQFLNVEHITRHFGNEPGYICQSWITLDEHSLGCFLDQAILPMELLSLKDLRLMHIPKTSKLAFLFDGHRHEKRTESVYWQKKMSMGVEHDKPGLLSMWYDLHLEASFVVHQVG